MKGSERNNFSGGITLMYNKDKISIRNYTSIGYNKSKNSPYGSFSTYAKMQPYYSPYDSNGNIIKYLPNFYMTQNDKENPIYDASLNIKDESGYHDISNNLAVDWTFIEGLILRGQFGISSNYSDTDLFYPSGHSKFVDYTGDDITRKGSYYKKYGRATTLSGTLTLSYNKVINDVHQLYAGLNYEIYSSKTSYEAYTAEGFFNQNLNNIGNAVQYAEGGKPSSSDDKTHRLGFTCNLNYTYDNRAFIDFSYRIDGSSEYGTDKKYWLRCGSPWIAHQAC